MSGLDLTKAWWPATGKPLPPLQAVRLAAEAMDAHQAVPAAAAAVLVSALRKYLAGEGDDITRNLGLRPRKGGRHEAPLKAERRKERDALIVRIFQAQPGAKKTKKAGQVAAMLGAESLASEITDADLAAAMLALKREYGQELPTSARQVLRVVNAAN